VVAHEHERAGDRFGVRVVDGVAGKYPAGQIPRQRWQVDGHQVGAAEGLAPQNDLPGLAVFRSRAREGNDAAEDGLGVLRAQPAVRVDLDTERATQQLAVLFRRPGERERQETAVQQGAVSPDFCTIPARGDGRHRPPRYFRPGVRLEQGVGK